MGAGGKGGGGGKAHDYYGTLAGLVCAGPVDAILGIVADGKTVWPEADGEWEDGANYTAGQMVHRAGRAWECSTTHTASALTAPGESGAPWIEYALRRTDPGVTNPVSITVPGYGVAILYWGTADQVHGAGIPEIENDHPPYRRQCWVILRDWLFGRERVSAPSVEVLVRRAPNQAAITGPAAELDADGQANLLAFGAQLIEDPVFGAGRPDLVADWQGLADEAQTRPDLWSLSPVIRKPESLRVFGAALTDYLDGFWRMDQAGAITAGRWPVSEAQPNWTPELTVDLDVLIEPVAMSTDPVTVTEASVRYSDRSRSFKERTAKATDTLSRNLLDAESVTLDRPWITRAGQAALAAVDHLRRNAEPVLTGTAVCRRERVRDITPGTVFLLIDNEAGVRLPCRCESVTLSEPPSGRATIRFRSESNYTPLATLNSATGFDPANPPAAEEVELYQFVQPPPLMFGGEPFALTVLAARTSPVTTGLRVHLQEEDPTLFYELGDQVNFATYGTLAAAYPSSYPGTANPDDNTEALRIDIDPSTLPADMANLGSSQSSDAINDNSLLLWIFKDSDPKAFEVLTVRASRMASGETFYRVKARRARFGTQRLSFSAGDHCWIIPRANVTAYTHQRFGLYAVNGDPAVFRLQAQNPWRRADLTDPLACPDLPFTFGDPYAPRVTWTGIEQRPAGGSWATVTDFSTHHPLGTQFRLSFTLSDANGDLRDVFLRCIGPEETTATLFSELVSGAEDTVSAEIELDEGDWTVVARISDRTNRVTEAQLTEVGGPTLVHIRVRPPGSNLVANPVATPRGIAIASDASVALTCSTAGSAIEWQVVALNAGVGGSWTAYAGPVTVPPDSTLYARATKGGMVTSPTVRHSYRYQDADLVA